MRRTVSFSMPMYNLIRARAIELGVTMSKYVEDLIRKDQGIEELAPPQLKPRGPDPRVIAARAALTKPPDHAAIENPCRLERCGRVGLHAAHEEDPALFTTRDKRREAREERDADPYAHERGKS